MFSKAKKPRPWQEGNTHLGSARNAIKRGRGLTQLLLVQLRNKESGLVANARVQQTVVDTMLTYHESFQVEERIVMLIGDSLGSLENGEEPRVLGAIEPLVERRFELQQRRKSLVHSVSDRLR